MKWKVIFLLIILLFSFKIFSQEFYLGYRVVTRAEID